jgi:hypothetical protein
MEYHNTSSPFEKGVVVNRVMYQIASLNPPGRFLEFVDSQSYYRYIFQVVSFERAFNQTCQGKFMRSTRTTSFTHHQIMAEILTQK